MPVEWGQTLTGVKKCSSIEAEVANGAINAVFISLVFSLFFKKKKLYVGRKTSGVRMRHGFSVMCSAEQMHKSH